MNIFTVYTGNSTGGLAELRVVCGQFHIKNSSCALFGFKPDSSFGLLHNPFTIFHFFWPQLDRQIAIYGRVEKTSREESEEYFNSRPVDSRIGAWTSNQSRVIESREALEKRFEEFREKFGDNVPLPPYWGGFRLTPDKFEFWQGRQNRLHDRICYTLIDHKWEISRLSP